MKTLAFLTSEAITLGQASLKWLLAEPLVVTTLPNIYDDAQLAEFAQASDVPDLTAEQLARVSELDAANFGIDEDVMKFKGAMTRGDGANLDLQDGRNPISRPARAASTTATC